MTWQAFRASLVSRKLLFRLISVRKTTSFPIPLFTVGTRLPSLDFCLISVLNISLRNFQGRCLLFSYQGAFCLFRSSATTSIFYHVAWCLSTTFFIFSFSVFSRIRKKKRWDEVVLRRLTRQLWYNITSIFQSQPFFLFFFYFFIFLYFLCSKPTEQRVPQAELLRWARPL